MGLLSFFCTAAIMKFSLVNIIGGLLFGTGIGFVPAYTTYMAISSNCTLYHSAGACASVLHSDCQWIAHGNTSAPGADRCDFTTVHCAMFNSSEALCEADSNHGGTCFFDHSAKMCKNAAGYTALASGIFAGAMILGCMAGCAVGGTVVEKCRTKGAMLLMAAVALLGCLLIHLSAWKNVFALLILGRIVYGVACGIGCVCCPMYTELHAPVGLRSAIGSLFQVSITFAIAVTAAIGLALNPTDATFASPDAEMQLRFQLYVGFPSLMSVLVALVAVFIDNEPNVVGLVDTTSLHPLDPQPDALNDSSTRRSSGKHDTPWQTDNTSADGTAADDDVARPYTLAEMRVPLLAGIVMAATAQMTGINAVMNYAPAITKSMDLAPLTGNCICMVWNWLTCMVALPIASRVTMRKMFLSGALLISISCLCLGVPVYPGVAPEAVKRVLSIAGVTALIAVFEMGLGPPFWVLTQQLFPVSFRARGASITTVALQLFNLIINVSFPLAVQGLSGGPNGDQDEGMAITFVIFGAIGTAGWFALLKLLIPFSEREGLRMQ